MLNNYYKLQELVETALQVKHPENWEMIAEDVLGFVRDLINQPLMESQAESYDVSETPLSALEFDAELFEAALHFLKDENKLRRDKDGKAIVGMHKGTNRYKGDKKDRDKQKAKAYYDRGNNREIQNARMRKRRAIEKNVKKADQNAKDRAEAEERDIPLSQIRDERNAKKKEARAKKRAEGAESRNVRAEETRARNKAAADKAAEDKKAAEESSKKSDAELMAAWAANRKKK